MTAVEHSMAGSSQHDSGTRLLDHADIVIDICVPVGDAAVKLDGVDTPVGPVQIIGSDYHRKERRDRLASLLDAHPRRDGQLRVLLSDKAKLEPGRHYRVAGTLTTPAPAVLYTEPSALP